MVQTALQKKIGSINLTNTLLVLTQTHSDIYGNSPYKNIIS